MNKLEIRWSDSDMGDDEKAVLLGTVKLPDGQEIGATGLTRFDVMKKLNEKLLLGITGRFINKNSC